MDESTGRHALPLDRATVLLEAAYKRAHMLGYVIVAAKGRHS